MSASVSGDLGLEEFMDDVEEELNNEILKIAEVFYKYQADDDIGTVPVDTGRFRASWNVSFDAPDTSHEDVNDNGPFSKPKFDLDGNVFESVDNKIVINNSIPYGAKLNGVDGEDGTVQQVPDRFFETNFQDALQRVESGQMDI